MDRIALTGLIRIALPGRDPVLLCSGGFKNFGGERYLSADPLFGTIGSLAALDEGVGDEVPALEIGFKPPGSAPVDELSQPGYQRAICKFWIAEFNYITNAIIGTPDLVFLGQLDQTILRVGKERVLNVTVVSTAERLFERNIGNSLSSNFHKSIWPGELGHDNGTGLGMPVAWGVEDGRGSTGSGGGFSRGMFGRLDLVSQ